MTRQSKWKRVSGGHILEMIPIVLFSDNVSGNESKKWNELNVWAMMLGGLPKELIRKLENIHFMCASSKVECCELVKPILAISANVAVSPR